MSTRREISILTILIAAMIAITVAGCTLNRAPGDIATPNTDVNVSTDAPVVQPADPTADTCVNSTINTGETETAVLDTIGFIPMLTNSMGETGLPAGDELDANVQAAAKVYMAHADQPITAKTQIKVCVNKKGFITSVNDAPVPTP